MKTISSESITLAGNAREAEKAMYARQRLARPINPVALAVDRAQIAADYLSPAEEAEWRLNRDLAEALAWVPQERLSESDVNRLATLDAEKRSEGRSRHKIPNYED